MLTLYKTIGTLTDEWWNKKVEGKDNPMSYVHAFGVGAVDGMIDGFLIGGTVLFVTSMVRLFKK